MVLARRFVAAVPEKIADRKIDRGVAPIEVLSAPDALPRHPIETVQARIGLTEAPNKCRAYVERIDHANSNAPRLWREAGASEYPSRAEVERLQDASRIRKEPHLCEVVNGILHLDIALPPHAVAAITVEFAPEQAGAEATEASDC